MVKFDYEGIIWIFDYIICFFYVGVCGMEIIILIEYVFFCEEFRYIFMLVYCKG